MFGLNKEELRILKKLNTPKKIQDFLDTLEINFEYDGMTCMSPRRVLRERKAHCIEAAMLAALALRIHGHEPLILDLSAVDYDEDHVIAVFRQFGKWGAISKTNHTILRYREPIYSSIHELAISHFHEFYDYNRKKTLRSYSIPVNMKRFDKKGWMTSEIDLWYVNDHLFEARHIELMNKAQIANLRKVDQIEVDSLKLTEWKRRDSGRKQKKQKISGKQRRKS
ncbi:MAG: hypothetical protein NT001_05140 [Candidatus Woesearchaeota archaeon]|nr:hypothetical protein [Candidatus Woesearchaeota archaeon]